MNDIQKVSDITYQDLAEYIRLDEISQENINTLNNMKVNAETFIKSYTGRTNLDEFGDFVEVVFVLVQDMWDNRSLYVDKTNLNFVTEAILGVHRVNLL